MLSHPGTLWVTACTFGLNVTWEDQGMVKPEIPA
jgi:hypothetical protein